MDSPGFCPSGIGGGGDRVCGILGAHAAVADRVRKRTLETKGKTLFYIPYSINLFLIEIVVFRFQEADKWRS